MLFFLVLVLSACDASVNVAVVVHRSGSGTVAVTVRFDRAARRQVEDLRTGLPVADLRRAGWSVTRPAPWPGGGAELVAEHSFARLSQLPVLMADIAGTGPLAQRPFRLSVTEAEGWLADGFTATATVDLRCGLACFDDPGLGRRVGYDLGLPSAEAARLIGRPASGHLHFRLQLSLPGRRSTVDAPARARDWPASWVTPLGRRTTRAATSRSVDRAHLYDLRTALVVGSTAVFLTALALAGRGWRGRHRRRRLVVTRPR